jgi:hypothetical protein
MKIREASKDFTEGEILLPSSNTSYIEENTSTGEEKKGKTTQKHTEIPRRTI